MVAKTKPNASSKRKSTKKLAGKQSLTGRVLGPVWTRHRRDLLGLVAILGGLLSAASLWFGAAGALGTGFNSALAVSVGLLRFVMPLALVGLGVALLRQTNPVSANNNMGTDQDSGTQQRVDARGELPARVTVGGVLLLISLDGLLHVFRGRPGLDNTIDELGAAGGVLGLGVGGVLYSVAALAGSVLILTLVGLFGVIVLTGTSANTLGRFVLLVLRPPYVWAREQIKVLFSDVSTASPVPLEPQSATQPALPQPNTNHSEPSGQIEPTTAPQPLEAHTKTGKGRQAQQLTTGKESQSPVEVGHWSLPDSSLLARSRHREVNMADITERGLRLQATLAQFGVETEMLEPIVGPTVTRYVLTLGEGVKVTKFESLRKDMALAMASPDVRILAPIPGRRAIGVEVPNSQREIVTIGDILASPEAQQAVHPLEVAVGRDINGRNVIANIANMPHVLIAGATGSGKSSCLNSLLSSILMRSTPDQVRLILVDPKRVEMGQYARTPHLLTAPVTDPRKAANALAWAVREMERRYDLLAEVGVRDITGYNQAVDDNTLKQSLGGLGSREQLTYSRLPFVLVVVDELADLMMVAARDVEESIARIAQMARAVGIHLVIATQRPSVNVITGVIKANIPSRWAFAVSSLTDSRVILDQPGAERLVGGGDLLMLGTTSSALNRIQGCWVEEAEVRAIVKHWHQQNIEERVKSQTATESTVVAETNPDVEARLSGSLEEVDLGEPTASAVTNSNLDPIVDSSNLAANNLKEDDDELLNAAKELVVQTQLGSTSMLQRKLRIGFARAGRIMDLLEQQGVVGPSTGSKAREVLISPQESQARKDDQDSTGPSSSSTTET